MNKPVRVVFAGAAVLACLSTCAPPARRPDPGETWRFVGQMSGDQIGKDFVADVELTVTRSNDVMGKWIARPPWDGYSGAVRGVRNDFGDLSCAELLEHNVKGLCVSADGFLGDLAIGHLDGRLVADGGAGPWSVRVYDTPYLWDGVWSAAPAPP